MSQVMLLTRHSGAADLAVFPKALLASCDVSDGAKLTLIAIASHQSAEGRCWPSQATLADKRGLTVRGVRKHVAELRKAGLLEVQRRRKQDGSLGGNEYRLVFQASDLTAANQRHKCAGGHPSVLSPSTGTHGDGSTGIVVPLSAARIVPVNNHPSGTNQKNPPRRAHARDADVPPSAPEKRPKREAPPMPLPAGWEPSGAARVFAEGAGLPVERVIREFRAYWQQRGDAKTPKGWEQTFANRVRTLHAQESERGKQMPPLPDWAECAKLAADQQPGAADTAGMDIALRRREQVLLHEAADRHGVRLPRMARWMVGEGEIPPISDQLAGYDTWLREASRLLKRPLPPFVNQAVVPGTGDEA